MLLGKGLTYSQIGELAGGISYKSIMRWSQGQSNTILAVKARQVLAVPLDAQAPSGDVPSVGSVRRLQALYALGHFNRVIAEETGLCRDAVNDLVNGRFSKVSVGVESAVRAAYDKLSMATGTSWRTRKFAEDRGWVPPLAWDDDTIDDPRAVPQTDAVGPVATEGENVAARWLLGEAVILGRDDRREVLQHLFEWTNHTAEEIASRLDMSPAAASQQWERIKKRARDEGRRVWRRVYVPRERDLNQNEMKEAA
ncbi:hypothetical protein [Streptomyces sp. PU_AKi4]|uniref:hypothetical protein n=1 Tax=Streptomyces sp. PU_AKi4 TaxID=2800809 RepID=UPI0035269B60